MKTTRRPHPAALLRGLLWTAGVLIGAAVLAIAAGAIWLTWFFELDPHRERVAALASQATGATVTIDGTLQQSGLAPVHLEARDITVNNGQQTVGAFQRVVVELSPLRLLFGTLHLDHMQVQADRLELVRHTDGHWNIAPALAKDQTQAQPYFQPDTIRLDELDFHVRSAQIHDQSSGTRLAAERLRLHTQNIPLLKGNRTVVASPSIVTDYRYPLNLSAESLHTPSLRLAEVDLALNNDYGDIATETLKLRVLDNNDATRARLQGKGSVRVRFADQARSRSTWAAPTTLTLLSLDTHIPELDYTSANGKWALSGARLKADNLPLPRSTTAGTAELKQWLARALAANQAAVSLQADGAHLGRHKLASFSTAIAADDETHTVHFDGRGLAVDGEQAYESQGIELEATLRATAPEEPAQGNGPLLQGLAIQSGRLKTADTKIASGADTPYSYQQLRLDVEALPVIRQGRVVAASLPGLVRGMTAESRLDARIWGFGTDKPALDRLAVSLRGREENVQIEQLEAVAGESRLRGDGQLRPDTGAIAWTVNLQGEPISLPVISDLLGSELRTEGRVRLTATLRAPSLTMPEALEGLNGNARIQGRDLKAHGIDMDQVLDQLLESQSVGLFDIGAYALLGPLGPLLTTGTSYAQLAAKMNAEGTTRIRHSQTIMSFDNGTAHLDGTAFATDKYRVAVKGTINVPPPHGLDLTTAVINPHGCARYVEEIGGTLGEPKVSRTGLVIKGVTQPIKSVVTSIAELFGHDCDTAFYQGDVKAP